MGEKQSPPTWYFRDGGLVTITAHDVADAGRFHLENGFARLIRGETLSAPEAEAVDAAKASGQLPPLSTLNSADARLGMVGALRPDILQALDAFARELGGADAFGELVAWGLLADYCNRAAGVTADELGIGGEPEDWAARHVSAGDMTEAEGAAFVARLEAEDAAATAWEASPEGRAAAEAMQPDGGPEGWSQVPPGGAIR